MEALLSLCGVYPGFLFLKSPTKKMVKQADTATTSSTNTTTSSEHLIESITSPFDSFDAVMKGMYVETQRHPERAFTLPRGFVPCPESTELVTTPNQVCQERNPLANQSDSRSDSEGFHQPSTSSSDSFFDGWFTSFAQDTCMGSSTSSLSSLSFSPFPANNNPLWPVSQASTGNSNKAERRGCERALLLGVGTGYIIKNGQREAAAGTAPWAVSDASDDDSPSWLKR